MIHLINPENATEVLLSKDGDRCLIRVYTPTTGWGAESTLPRGHEAAYELLQSPLVSTSWVLHPESPENFEEFMR